MPLRRDTRIRRAVAWADGEATEWLHGRVVGADEATGDVVVEWDGGATETLHPRQIEPDPGPAR